MAEGSIIRFDKEHSVKVQEDPEAVAEAIIGAGAANVAIVRLTRTKGDRVLINAHQIRSISSPEEHRSASF